MKGGVFMKKYLCIVMAAAAVMAMATGAFAVVYGKSGYESYGYSASTAWEINSAAVLAKVRDDYNSGNELIQGGYFKLTKDIDLTSYTDWEPIGANIPFMDDAHFFTGHFDGNGHTIKINISRLQNSSPEWWESYCALFGVVTDNATIKNLTVEGNVDFSVRALTERHFVGGIAAYLCGGSIENCNFDGTVSTNQLASGMPHIYAGGIVGYVGGYGGFYASSTIEYYSIIKNCKVGSKQTTTITAKNSTSVDGYTYAGGIAGYFEDSNNNSVMSNCWVKAYTNVSNGGYDGILFGGRGGFKGKVSGNTEIDPDEEEETVTITKTSLSGGTAGTYYSDTLTADKSGVTWSVSSGSLPAGLSLNASTGVIAGTPSTAGTYTFTVKAAYSSVYATKTYTITIAAATPTYTLTITKTSLASGTAGTYYSDTLTATLSGSAISPTWSLKSGSLPSGLSLNASTGAITGTPSAAGTYTFTVSASFLDITASKIYIMTIAAAQIPSGIAVNATNFPDAVFRSYVSENFDTDSNGVLSETEIAKATRIEVEEKGISSLKGIEYFTGLHNLYCRHNQLTALDVSKNTALEILYCYNNQLTALDVSKNTALEILYCYNNQLTALDVSKNTDLTQLWCWNNQLTALDVSKNTALRSLRCNNNQLTALDVSKNTDLTYLDCTNNQLTALDVSKNTALYKLYCYGNQLTALDVSKNTALTELACSSNQLTALDVSKNIYLTYLSCYGNQLTVLNVSKNTALTHLNCNDNQLTSLILGNNSVLATLKCSNNSLALIDISECPSLTSGTFSHDDGVFIIDSTTTFSITTSSLASGKVGTAYSQELTAQVSGSTISSAWSVTSGTLPTGLSLNSNDGTITGTPTASGSYTFTVEAGFMSLRATKTYTVTIAAAQPAYTLTITKTSLASGTVNTAYSDTLTAQLSGGSYAITWAATGLPSWLTLNAYTGALTGTPTAAGNYTFTVTAYAGQYSSSPKQFTLTVAANNNDDDAPEIPITIEQPEFRNFSIMMEGQIGMNFYVYIPDDTYTPENCWMEFNVRGDTAHTPQPLDYTFTRTVNGVKLYGFRCYINAGQMADPITATLHYGNGQTLAEVYSAKTYLDTALGTPGFSQIIKNLMTAIKNYGHYVQPMLSKERGWVIGEKYLFMEAQTELTDDDINNAEQAVEPYAMSTNLKGTGISDVRFSLTMGSETTINVYIFPASGYSGSIAAYIDGSSQNNAIRDGTRYKVQISDISAKNLGDMHTINIVADAESTVKISALSYADSIFTTTLQQIGKVDIDTMRKTAAALYNYYKTARAYADSR